MLCTAPNVSGECAAYTSLLPDPASRADPNLPPSDFLNASHFHFKNSLFNRKHILGFASGRLMGFV